MSDSYNVPYVAPHNCEWRSDDEGNWNTSCDNIFYFIGDGPEANDANFCQYCGGNLVEIPYADTDSEDDDDEA